jgi:hypothetical protein
MNRATIAPLHSISMVQSDLPAYRISGSPDRPQGRDFTHCTGDDGAILPPAPPPKFGQGFVA